MKTNQEKSNPVSNVQADVVRKSDKKNTEGFLRGFVRHLNIIIPLVVVCVCAIVVSFLIREEIEHAGSVQGKYVCVGAQEESYVIFERGGSYTLSESGIDPVQSGTWESDGERIILKSDSSDSTEEVYFVDNKYIAFRDENFLSGNVPSECLFDAQFTADDGTVYVFGSDGKCYTSEEGRNTELGGYITDGMFIVITIEDTAHTYLNCGDGITSVYYTQS